MRFDQIRPEKQTGLVCEIFTACCRVLISGISSISTLTVLSFERYVMISKPFSSHHLTLRCAYWLVLAIWSYSALLTVPPLFGWGEYSIEAANIR